MRPHGNARIDQTRPQSQGVCDRCGFIYTHADLNWQFQWAGPKLQNMRILVCQTCMDKPQESGLRTIIIPADPLPTINPRPEDFVNADNPLSGLGWDPATAFPGAPNLGSNLGSMQNVDAAFSGSPNKSMAQCAQLGRSTFGFFNWVGKNWAAEASGQPAPQQTHIAAAFTATAPNNQPFLASGATSWQFQGSANGVVWVTLSQGATVGNNGEVITMTIPSGIAYQYHRLVLNGDGMNPIGIAQLAINVGDAYAIQG